MSIRFLINPDGSAFGSSELRILNDKLDSLDDSNREEYRNQNATAIAQSNAPNFLIVSGPGTGKSHLFLQKINHWFQQDPNTKIAVTSFVRKLVEDLEGDIGRANLTDIQKNNITVSTLHRFALSIVEKNKGTKNWPLKSNIQVIVGFWEEIFWNDVFAFHQGIDRNLYSWKEFKPQLDKDILLSSGEWSSIFTTYLKLCQFYNACSFADSILRARQALEENPGLNELNHFIIDEYQDFNPAEEALVTQLVINAQNILIVGDDEQVLYSDMKSSSPDLIRALYYSSVHVNGILPFCGRCGYHITKSASHFIQQHRKLNSIEKIYLPLKSGDVEQKVQIVACARPVTAVDYIEKFVDEYKSEIDVRKNKLESREEKEAFLMILTPIKDVEKIYGADAKNLKEIIAPYQVEIRSFSRGYHILLNYYSLAENLQDNFIFRKILYHMEIPIKKIYNFVEFALNNQKNLYDLGEPEIKIAIDTAQKIKLILESPSLTPQSLDQIVSLIGIDKEELKTDLEYKCVPHNNMGCLKCIRKGGNELESSEVKQMNAVELMTIPSSKGLSADHVIIIGFDDRNMDRITDNAFYVAMTRARKSLHIITAMRSGGASQAHRFLDQLPDDHIEFHKYTKGNCSKSPLQGKSGFKRYIKSLQSWNKTN